MKIKELTLEPGFVVIRGDSGPSTRFPVSDMLRAEDVPTGLTYTQVTAITTLANLVATLIRTLIDRQVLDETFADSKGMSYDLDHIIHSIEQMGGAYHNPDIGA